MRRGLSVKKRPSPEDDDVGVDRRWPYRAGEPCQLHVNGYRYTPPTAPLVPCVCNAHTELYFRVVPQGTQGTNFKSFCQSYQIDTDTPVVAVLLTLVSTSKGIGIRNLKSPSRVNRYIIVFQ